MCTCIATAFQHMPLGCLGKHGGYIRSVYLCSVTALFPFLSVHAAFLKIVTYNRV